MFYICNCDVYLFEKQQQQQQIIIPISNFNAFYYLAFIQLNIAFIIQIKYERAREENGREIRTAH